MPNGAIDGPVEESSKVDVFYEIDNLIEQEKDKRGMIFYRNKPNMEKDFSSISKAVATNSHDLIDQIKLVNQNFYIKKENEILFIKNGEEPLVLIVKIGHEPITTRPANSSDFDLIKKKMTLFINAKKQKFNKPTAEPVTTKASTHEPTNNGTSDAKTKK